MKTNCLICDQLIDDSCLEKNRQEIYNCKKCNSWYWYFLDRFALTEINFGGFNIDLENDQYIVIQNDCIYFINSNNKIEIQKIDGSSYLPYKEKYDLLKDFAEIIKNNLIFM